MYINGVKVSKGGKEVSENDKIEIIGDVNPYVSKGGLKLEKAIKEFELIVIDKNVIDIGSSTGGFTDCLLKNGAKKVYAIDVGCGQMVKSLKENSKVVLMENTDFRNLSREDVGDAEMIVGDVSFISLLKLLPKVCELNIDVLVLLIKPQFECGIEMAKKYKGVVKDKNIHKEVLKNVINGFKTYGYLCEKATFSPITGGDGNIEYIALFKKSDRTKNTDFNIDIFKLVDNAFDNFI